MRRLPVEIEQRIHVINLLTQIKCKVDRYPDTGNMYEQMYHDRTGVFRPGWRLTPRFPFKDGCSWVWDSTKSKRTIDMEIAVFDVGILYIF